MRDGQGREFSQLIRYGKKNTRKTVLPTVYDSYIDICLVSLFICCYYILVVIQDSPYAPGTRRYVAIRPPRPATDPVVAVT